MTKPIININIDTLNVNVNVNGAAASAPVPAFVGELSHDEAMGLLSSLFGDRFMTGAPLPDSGVPATPPQDPPVAQQGSADQAGDTLPAAGPAFDRRITTDNIGDLNPGDPVSWVGAKFLFTGVVEEVNDLAADDDKMVFVRRDDTGKLVSLTGVDIDTHQLMLLERSE